MAKVQIKSDNFTAFGGVLTTETCIWQSWPLEGKYTYRCITTNDYEMSLLDVVHFYNQRGGGAVNASSMNSTTALAGGIYPNPLWQRISFS